MNYDLRLFLSNDPRPIRGHLSIMRRVFFSQWKQRYSQTRIKIGRILLYIEFDKKKQRAKVFWKFTMDLTVLKKVRREMNLRLCI